MKVLVVSQDAGGAEIVSSWVRQNSENEYQFILEEPANKIFGKKLLGIKNNSITKLKKIIEDSDFVITGTSQSSDLEKVAIKQAKRSKIISATFLDYWYGYKERFMLSGKMVLPDEIWVGDSYALELAEKELPEAVVNLKNNPYLEDLLREKEVLGKREPRKSETLHILYLCQPYEQQIRNTAGEKKTLTDTSALKYFLELLTTNSPVRAEVRLRLHPLEPSGKYGEIISGFNSQFNISESFGRRLSEDLVWSDIAVGMQAQALAVAVSFGKKVYHCIPNGGHQCVLPHKEIQDFSAQKLDHLSFNLKSA